MVRCALVCITKNEKKYMREFISYYLKLGFRTLFLYDNSSFFELKSLHQPPSVNIIRFPGNGRQLLAYKHFLAHYKKQFDYVAFFDSDEFLVLKKHRDIGEFCLEHIPSGAIGVNWYIFGNNGRTHYEEDLVIRRFLKRDKTMHPLVKTIGKCSDIVNMNIHHPVLKNGQFLNCRKQVLHGPFNTDFDDSITQLNHYCTKSDQEYAWKIMRGRGSVAKRRNYNDLAEYLTLNHVEDTFALRFYTDQSLSGIALVLFTDSVSTEENRYWWKNNAIFSQVFIYHNQNSTRNDYQQHFLTYHKNSFLHVLFIEATDQLEGTDLQLFCKEKVQTGAVFIKSKCKEGKRVLGRCADLLEMKNFEILKIGYGETARETDEIFWF